MRKSIENPWNLHLQNHIIFDKSRVKIVFYRNEVYRKSMKIQMKNLRKIDAQKMQKIDANMAPKIIVDAERHRRTPKTLAI